ncbi:hypothetical protein [Paenibacillus sp. Soil787]|uniref:hypothetical protein n=1 Tax=Paenibacillus sp. Soil787 TaxID=1736411 RepID=UPI000703591C|nr:hypothetical protein [Paenibacillus sp. Soil787]KRF19355.1 hypothetical protein ASG93_32325 [Paenibacillus sp. Soil787]
MHQYAYKKFRGEIDIKMTNNNGCGKLIESAPQRLTTNKMAAQIVNNIINTLLTEKAILVHHVTFDSRLCGVKPQYVTKEQGQLFGKVTESVD